MILLETKHQVKRMFINYYDLYYTVSKNKIDNEIVNDNENDFINFNDFITVNPYSGIKPLGTKIK